MKCVNIFTGISKVPYLCKIQSIEFVFFRGRPFPIWVVRLVSGTLMFPGEESTPRVCVDMSGIILPDSTVKRQRLPCHHPFYRIQHFRHLKWRRNWTLYIDHLKCSRNFSTVLGWKLFVKYSLVGDERKTCIIERSVRMIKRLLKFLVLEYCAYDIDCKSMHKVIKLFC